MKAETLDSPYQRKEVRHMTPWKPISLAFAEIEETRIKRLKEPDQNIERMVREGFASAADENTSTREKVFR